MANKSEITGAPMRSRNDEISCSRPMSVRILRVIRSLQKRGVRGSTKLLNVATAAGLFEDMTLTAHGVTVTVTPEHPMLPEDIPAYEPKLIQALTGAVRIPSVYVDCGAAIGVVAAKAVAACPMLRQVIALEPNRTSYAQCVLNVQRLPQGVAYNCAVGASSGRGRLVVPPNAIDRFGWCIEPDEQGDIEVRSIDSLALPSNLGIVLKIDVEGGEHAVISGAKQSIQRAPAVVVTLEAHREVMDRVGDLARTLCLMNTYRPFQFRFAETGAPIDISRPVAEQMPLEMVAVNVIAVT